MEQKIFLNKNKSKTNGLKESIVFFKLDRNYKLLPIQDIENNVDLLDIYNNERYNCNKIRLTCKINPICTNILFNNVTEITKNEGSSSAICLNHLEYYKEKNSVIGKPLNFSWNQDNAIQDTQLSSLSLNFNYHCGTNIYNNHILRNKTFKCSINTQKIKDDNFNTISDYLRDDSGNSIYDYSIINTDVKIQLHLYLKEELYSFLESKNNNLTEQNGWFGFINPTKLDTNISDEGHISINKTINNKESCDFIEMYPDSKLYSFNPKYNEYRNRLEKNWNYCLTYPSSSTTYGFEFINSEIDSLKILYFIEKDNYIRFYSMCKHNLKIGDYVNIYNNTELIIENGLVTSIGYNKNHEDFIFSISSNGNIISNNWHIITSNEYSTSKIDNLDIDNRHKLVIDRVNNKSYYIVENAVNIDDNFKNLSFKKINNGEEVDYYVRIFSKLPNWKYANHEVNGYNIYDNINTSNLLNSCQQVSADFESHITKMAFSKNIYNDDISQIIYNDDIDISYLRDNLNRPITDIYLTIIKNNKGYKEWYGKNSTTSPNISADTIEYSHCFGKLTCAFELSKQSMVNSGFTNLLLLNNIISDDKYNSMSGYNINKINVIQHNESDEINYYDNINFYGDLCEYSNIEQNETPIQMIGFRFNTAQRELNKNDFLYKKFSAFTYNEISSDDFDYEGFKAKDNKIENVCQEQEGYYYFPHFKIPIHTFSKNIKTGFPLIRKIHKINKNGNNICSIATLLDNYLENNDKFVIFDMINNKYYNGVVLSDGIVNSRLFKCKIDEKLYQNDNLKIENLQLLNPNNSDIPSYGHLLKDGTSRYVWKEILHNGTDTSDTIETYPFTNNRLYVNSNINLYLLRQDPFNDSYKYTLTGKSLVNKKSINYISGNSINNEVYSGTNNYYNSESITC